MNNDWSHRSRWRQVASVVTALLLYHPACGQEDVAETPKAQVAIDTTPLNEPPITQSDRQHWAFLPLQRPAIPDAATAALPRTPIDAFIVAKLQAHGGEMARQANRATLIRRLSLDLHGIPPTPEE